jgi:chemotaxis protein methyltransferase CheR
MTLSSASFEYVRSVLRERTGHLLGDDKVYLVESRLFPVALQRGHGTVEELITRLRAVPRLEVLQQVLDAMTIKETSFFRDLKPFDDLREEVLPELIRRRTDERRLHLWCAACSTGQEAYSLALLLQSAFPELRGWTIRLLASDLSPTALSRARQGCFSDLEVGRGVSAEMLSRFFRPVKAGWQVIDEVRRMVEFLPLNLVERWPALPPLDLVLMRNVLIYFDLPTRQQILTRTRQVLRPDGWLMLGGAETTHNIDAAFELVRRGATTFFRPGKDA